MLEINAKKLEAVAVLSLRGQIVTGETEILLTAVSSLQEPSAVILDLAKVTTVDAHGLGVLLRLREQAVAKGVSFRLMNVNKPLRRVFEITCLDTVFQISPPIEFFPAVSRDRRMPVAALRSCA